MSVGGHGTELRLSILGGGGFRVPLVHAAILEAKARRPAGSAGEVTDLVLHDVDERRLAVISQVVRQQAEAAPVAGPRLDVTTDLDRALTDVDAVFSAIRVGGSAGRVQDEEIALRAGVLGQETVGAAGIAYALRTLPVALDIAKRLARRSPRAWLLNFTNPAGLVTQACLPVLGGRVVGICDSPLGLVRRAAHAAGVDLAAPGVEVRYLGVNHLGWLTGLLVAGIDWLPGLLADPASLARFEEGRLFGAQWLAALGSLPNEYLYYYDRADEALAGVRRHAGRGSVVHRQQESFFEAAAQSPAGPLELWESARAEREATYLAEARGEGESRNGEAAAGGGYAEVALAVLQSLSGAETALPDGAPLILGVANGGAVQGLPDDVVVEVPCRVDAAGVQPVSQPPPTLAQLGALARQKAVEADVISAVTTRSRAAALRAFATHPLVGSVATARRLLEDYLAASPALRHLLKESGAPPR